MVVVIVAICKDCGGCVDFERAIAMLSYRRRWRGVFRSSRAGASVLKVRSSASVSRFWLTAVFLKF